MAAAEPKYRYVGEGSYGVIIKPALPNFDEHGSRTNYESNITKVYFLKERRDKALTNSEDIVRLMGDESVRMYPYTYSYKYNRLKESNVNSRIIEALRAREVPEDLNLQILRMRDLGVEIGDLGLEKEPYNSYRESLRNVPFSTILQQIRKVFGQIHALNEGKYIHGDIRQRNVLVNPNTGDISLIDFDLFNMRIDFFMKYHGGTVFGFYNTPPESLLLQFEINELKKIIDPSIPADTIVDKIPKELIDKYVADTVTYWKGVKGDYIKRVESSVKTSLIYNIEYLRTKVRGIIKFDVFDNYGLAATLLMFLKHVYLMNPPQTSHDQGDYFNELERLLTNGDRAYTKEELIRIIDALYSLENLLNRVSSFLISKRPTPENVLKELDVIIATFEGAAGGAGAASGGGGGSSGGARRTRRRRHTHRRRQRNTRSRKH